MEQQESLQNFFPSSMTSVLARERHNKEHGEEMRSIDVKTHQIPDIKFDQFQANEH